MNATRFRWTQKPPVGYGLDRSHPLARGLRSFYAANEGSGGRIYDATGNLDLSAQGYGNNNPWGVGPGGIGVLGDTPAASTGFEGTVPAALRFDWPMSIAFAARFIAGGGSNQRIFGVQPNSSNVAPFVAITFYAAGSASMGYGIGSGGTFTGLGTYAATPGVDYVFGLSVGPTAWAFYVNGALNNSGSGSFAAPTWGATPQVTAGGWSAISGANSGCAPLYWGGWWSRALTAADHAAIGASPAAIFGELFLPPRTRAFFVAAGGAALATAGITLGALSASGSGRFESDATAAVTLGGLSASGAGTFLASASAPIVPAPLSASGSGTSGAVASAPIVLPGLAAVASGTSGTTATAGVTLAALSPSASGTFAATATAGVGLAALSASGIGFSGSVAIAGITLGPLAATGSATFGTTAGAGVTLSPLSAAASGFAGSIATAGIALARLSSSGSGSFATAAAGAVTLGPLQAAGSGTLATSATAGIALGPLAGSAAAFAGAFATAAITLSPLSSAASGTFGTTAHAEITLSRPIVSAAGTSAGGQTPYGATDPLAATLVILVQADPSLCTSDPEDAELLRPASPDPALATSEPNDGSLLDRWTL